MNLISLCRQDRKAAVVLTLAFLAVTVPGAGTVFADGADISDNENVRTLIEQKAEELEKVNSQIEETQNKLQSIGSQKNTLKSAVSKLDYGINQADLKIKSSQIKIQKLGLEAKTINNEQAVIRAGIEDKKRAIGAVMRRLQEENRGIIEIILSDFTLSDSITYLQNMDSVRNGLVSDIGELRKLGSELDRGLAEAEQKQDEIRAEKNNYENTKSITLLERQNKEQLLAVTKNKESVYHKQLATLESQQNAIAEEIDKMEQRLISGLAPGQIPKPSRGLLSWPVEMTYTSGGRNIITQEYGNMDKSLYGSHPHNGIDIGTSIGTPIYAAADGIVMQADRNDINSWRKFQYGMYVLVGHRNGLSTLYAHLAKYLVSNGQQIKKGQLIAYSDNTGYSTGSHLHFGVYVTPAGGWKKTSIAPGLIRIPPANGLVPVGVTLDPDNYLP